VGYTIKLLPEHPDRPKSHRLTDHLGRWPLFALTCAVLFVLRGILVLSVLPPFEGWDEYQHLAYVVFLQQNGRVPVLGRDTVPPAMLETLREFPESHFAVLQLQAIGTSEYDTFWQHHAARPRPSASVKIPLYQAQHPALYYWLAGPIFAAFGGLHHVLRSITALRLLNVILGAAAVYMAVIAISDIWRDRRYVYLAGLLVALNPMYLLNCTRVANDALAVMLGTGVVLLLLRPPDSRPLPSAAATGLLLGLAVMAKVTALVLLPVAVLAVLLWVRTPQHRRVRGLLAAACLIAGFLLPTFAYFMSSLRQFGSLVPVQETIANPAQGTGIAGLLSAASAIDWPRLLGRLYVRDPLWVGGWSYLCVPGALYALYGLLVIACLVGCGALLVRRSLRHRPGFAGAEVPVVLVAIVGCTALGLAFHALQSMRAWGYVATNGWYGALALPFLFCLLVQGASAYPGRMATLAIIAGMATLFLGAELYGIFFKMIPHYTAHAGWPLIWQRLAYLHPLFPGPFFVVPAVVAVLVAAMLAGTTAVRAFLSVPPT
jgi:4-amino-4-deoxy-L-arabinose transferase-like glycosyltransferase